MRGLLAALALTALGSGCSSSDVPDARIKQPIVPDAKVADAPVGAPDAAVADDAPAGGGIDAAKPIDAAPKPVDAAPPIDAPLPSGPAEVVINELSPDFVDEHDLVELLVTRSGTTSGIKLEKDYPHDPVVLAELPDVIVFEGERIIVHLVPAGSGAVAETQAIDEKHGASNFDTAWDFLGKNDDIQYSDRVIAVRAASGTVTSAVPFFRADLSNDLDMRPRNFPDDLQGIITEGLWKETCSPSPCSFDSNLGAVTVSWLGAGNDADKNDATGVSVQRKAGGLNAGKVSDWKAIPVAAPFNSYGAAN